MLNIIWPIFLIISFIYAIISGNLQEVNGEIFNSIKNAVDISLSLLGTMCLWCGIMKIAMKTNLVNHLIKILYPAIKWLFPDVKEDEDTYKKISMNIIANLLGLGNAATPMGLQAIKNLQEKNNKKERLTNSMATLIILNTASIQIIPTTVIAIRTSLGSKNPTQILIPIWIATISAALSAICTAKILMKKW